MNNSNDFIIENGLLIKYIGAGGDVVIPNTVTDIRASAFEGCHTLTAITIPNSVTNIEDWAFYGCSALRDVTIQTNTVKFGQKILNPYNYQYSLHIDKLANLSPAYRKYATFGFAEEDADCTTERGMEHLKYLKSNAGKLVDFAISRPTLLALMCREKLIAAKDIEAYTVSAQNSGNTQVIAMILEYGSKHFSEKEKQQVADKKNTDTDEVTERKIARINQNGINGCVFAISGNMILFSDKNELKNCIESKGGRVSGSISSKVDFLITNQIGVYSEKNKKAEALGIEILTETEFIKRAGEYFVIDDGHLKRYIGNESAVSIPESVKIIDDSAFIDNKYLKSVSIPEGTTLIGYDAFKNCINLENIILPDTIESIGWNAFAYCSNLKDILIPANVGIIGNYAFSGCRNLTNITILCNTTRIEQDVFYDCNHLTIHALQNSSAERYADKKHIPFVAI